MGASSCNQDAPPFKWSPDIYIGDSRTQSLVRKNSAGEFEQMLCSEAKFDDMVAMQKDEIRKAREAYFDVINQCERWKNGSQDQIGGSVHLFDALEGEAHESLD